MGWTLVVAASVGLGGGCGGRVTGSEPGGGSGGVSLGAGGNPRGGGSTIFVDESTGGSGGTSRCDISRTLPNCMELSQAATMRTRNVLVLLDKSGSLGRPGLGSTTSRWDTVKTALNVNRVDYVFGCPPPPVQATR